MRIYSWLTILAQREGSDVSLATGALLYAKFEGEL